MPRKKPAQRYRRALIKKNAHSSGCQGTTRGVLEHGTDLLERNARKQLHEFRDRQTYGAGANYQDIVARLRLRAVDGMTADGESLNQGELLEC